MSKTVCPISREFCSSSCAWLDARTKACYLGMVTETFIVMAAEMRKVNANMDRMNNHLEAIAAQAERANFEPRDWNKPRGRVGRK